MCRPGPADYKEVNSLRIIAAYFKAKQKKNPHLKMFTGDIGELRCDRFPLKNLGRIDEENPQDGLYFYWQDDPLEEYDINYLRELGVDIERIESDHNCIEHYLK